ncbi:hypothetical protein M3Y98_00097600 [Aphelenchoides besseyi]|nr:hypothetical protein M3Y98_00097600 [Aphelenchoides besseyi]
MESTGLKPKLCTGFALEAFFSTLRNTRRGRPQALQWRTHCSSNGIPNLTIKSSDNHTIWLPLLQKMAPHLKNLQCPMECFGYNWPPMKLDAYINNFYSRKDKIGLSTLCSSVHEIRRIVSLSVNPTVEDAILEYRTDWRPSNLFGYSPPHLLKRLPNLRRVFYFMRINYHNGLSIQLTSLNTFVQEWLKELPNCKLIVNVQIHLSRDIVREDVLAEVRHSEFLHGQELSLVSNEELNNDPDLMLRSGYEMDNEIMVWTGERTKFFVWRRRQF